MSKPDFVSSQAATAELSRAEQLDSAGSWMAADSSYTKAVNLDTTPASRIAFGNSLATREQFHAAICQLTAALDMASAAGDREALGVIFHNLAGIYRELGDADLARRFQQRALLQMDDCGPSELLGLANDAWLSQRTELAACLASSCADLDDEGSLALEAQATYSVITAQTEDPRSGIRSLIRVYRQHQAVGAERLMGIDLLNLAVLLSAGARYQTEINMVRRAIRHFVKASAPVSAAKAGEVLANLQRMQSLREFDPSVN
jgi:tetratricopeptide (TPR) repeat protein